MCFMMMRSNDICPRCLTSEIFEHSFACMRKIIREFTTNHFIRLALKIDRFWNVMSDSNLNCARTAESSSCFKRTRDNLKSKKDFKLDPGPVKIETNMKISEI